MLWKNICSFADLFNFRIFVAFNLLQTKKCFNILICSWDCSDQSDILFNQLLDYTELLVIMSRCYPQKICGYSYMVLD